MMTIDEIKNSTDNFYTDVEYRDAGYAFVTVLHVWEEKSNEYVLEIEYVFDDDMKDDLLYMGFKRDELDAFETDADFLGWSK